MGPIMDVDAMRGAARPIGPAAPALNGRGFYRGTGFGTAARVILVVYRAIQRDQRVARRLD